MANLTLTRQWVENIYQLETTDPVMGGPDGVDNRQAKELGARTNWLKDQVDTINRDRTGYAPKASPAFTGVPTAPTANQNTNNTQIATTAFVKTAVQAVNNLAAGKQSPATTLAGYGIGNFKVEPFVGNVNTLQTDGVYAVGQASRSQNLPVPGNGCHIQVIGGGDSTWCRQIAYITYSGDMYERHQLSYQRDEWSPWKKLILDGLSESQLTPLLQAKADKTAFDSLYDLLIGVPIPYPLATVPAGCLAMNGQRFDKNRYPKLGQKYPSGVLPDMRGEFPRGWDNGRGVDAGRGLLSFQAGSSVPQEAHIGADNVVSMSCNDLNTLNMDVPVNDPSKQIRMRTVVVDKNNNLAWHTFPGAQVNGTHYVGSVRPRNIAFHYICLAA